MAQRPGSAAAAAPMVEESRRESKISYMSLPHKGQLALLCVARLIEPLATTSIQVSKRTTCVASEPLVDPLQSYMFYQLKFFNPSASASSISMQAGLLVGAKQAAAVCTGMIWGHFADSELGGRKPVLVIGLTSAGQWWVIGRTHSVAEF